MRLFISNRSRLPTAESFSSSASVSKNCFNADTGINTSSEIDRFAIFTYDASFLSRLPLQSGQVVLPR